MGWLTTQLVQHESSRVETEQEAKWWKHPSGFNYLFTPGEDEEPFPVPDGPPPGWERLPMQVEEPADGE